MGFKTRENIIGDLVKQVGEMDAHSWKKMWVTLGTTIPVSAVTGKAYRGGNRWMLLMKQVSKDYPTARWLTKKQIHQAGGRIKDEEFGKDVLCEYWQRKTKSKEKDGSPLLNPDKPGSFLMCKPFWLYNVAQCEGLPLEIAQGPVKQLEPLTNRLEKVDRLVQASGAKVKYGDDRAFYSPSTDSIGMPNPEQFTGATPEERLSHFYATLLHELAHWTGHSSRLNRLTLAMFGTPDYAREELVAEFASAILCAELEVPCEDLQHPEYLAHWLQVVKSDPEALLKGANAAEAAVKYLYASLAEEEEAPEEALQEAA